MHRPRGKSVSQTQDNESLPNIDAQLDYINKLLKWSTGELNHFIAVLMARLLAEEGYIRALEAIDRVPAAPAPEAPYSRTKYFGDQPSTFETALTEYTASVKNVVAQRRELVKGIKIQIKVMQGIKENQEKQHRTINEFVGEKNSRYLTFRTNDFFKRQRAYVHKCADLEAAQQALQPTVAKDDFVVTEEDAEEQAADTSSSSPREEENPAAPETQGSSNNNKRGNNIVLALRSQIAQAISTDPSKQNMKVAKLKRDVAETDLEYRRAAHRLELLRIMQVETARQAMKHIEVLFLMKADWARSVLYNITMAEEAALSKETLIVQARRERIQELDARKDVQLFCNQFERTMRFDVPAPIFYENHYFGRVNNVHFGASLRGYAKIHGRNVPIIVERCIQAVEAMGGLEKEGIYRISGRQSNINALKIEFEKDEHVNLDNTDVFTIASVLKIYLRELEEPLFPLSMSYRAEYSIKDTSSRLKELKTKINELPLPHRETLYIVIRHLARVNARSEVNKMNMQNISVIFTPAIFHDHNQAENVGEWCTDKVLEDLIHHCDQLFGNHNQNNENSDPASLKGHERTGSNSSQIPTPPPKNAKAGHQRTGSAPSAAQQANIVRKDSLRRPIPIRRDSLRSKNSAN